MSINIHMSSNINYWLVEAAAQVKQNTGEDCIVIQYSMDRNTDDQKPNYIAVQLVGTRKFLKLYDRDIMIDKELVDGLDRLKLRIKDDPSNYDLDPQTHKVIHTPVDYLIDIITGNDLFPSFEFVTEDFFVTEWLADYQSLQLTDIIKNIRVLNLAKAIGITSVVPKPTELLKDIYTKIEKFSEANKLIHNIDSANSGEDLGSFPTFDRLELLRNFHLKKKPTGEIEDWKFTGLTRIIFSDTLTKVFIVHDGKWLGSQPENTDVPTLLYNNQYYTI